MNLELVYMSRGAVRTLALTGTESLDEKIYKIEHGLRKTFEVYGAQYAVSNIGEDTNNSTTSIVKEASDNPRLRDLIVKYSTSVFNVVDRQIAAAIASGTDQSFVSALMRLPTRDTPKVESHPIIKILSSVPHIPIGRTSIMRSTYDNRYLSIFQDKGEGSYDLLILPDTLSIDGEGIIGGLRSMLSVGGTVVILETDYRDEISGVLHARAMIDYASGSIKNIKRYYKPKYQWHNILEREGLLHMASQIIDREFGTYVSAYTFLSDINVQIERTYALPPILRTPSDLFPIIEGAAPNVVLGVNYDIDDLYSIENPTVKDAQSIYTMIRKKSRSTPTIYIDGGGIGLLPVSFSKYSTIYVRTDRVQQTLDNLSIYRMGRISRQGSVYEMTAGKRKIYIGRELEVPPGCVVITTDIEKEYPEALYIIRRTPIGTRKMTGQRSDLESETLFLTDRYVRSYPEREILRLVVIERIMKIFRELVPGGDFWKYMFDIITMGQVQGILLDPVIPVTSSIIIPESLTASIQSIPSEWHLFLEKVEFDYPSYWETNREEALYILPFDKEAQDNFIDRFKRNVLSEAEDIGRSLYNYIHEQYKFFLDSIGKEIGVTVAVANNVMGIVPNASLTSIVGKRTIHFDVTPELTNGKEYRDVASMLLRHHIMSGAGKVLDVDVVHLFGSPGAGMTRWMSIFPDIDRTWGSLGSSMIDIPTSNVYFNPPYWNESMGDLLTKIVNTHVKVYVPRDYADKVRGSGTIIV